MSTVSIFLEQVTIDKPERREVVEVIFGIQMIFYSETL